MTFAEKDKKIPPHHLMREYFVRHLNLMTLPDLGLFQ
jgi:hypothetical protein